MSTIQPMIYHVNDVARILGCKPATIRRLLMRGLLPFRRLGSKYIVLRDELEAYLRSLPMGSTEVGTGGSVR